MCPAAALGEVAQKRAGSPLLQSMARSGFPEQLTLVKGDGDLKAAEGAGRQSQTEGHLVCPGAGLVGGGIVNNGNGRALLALHLPQSLPSHSISPSPALGRDFAKITKSGTTARRHTEAKV